MISAGSVFREPQYYRDVENAETTILDGIYGINRLFTEYSLGMLGPSIMSEILLFPYVKTCYQMVAFSIDKNIS